MALHSSRSVRVGGAASERPRRFQRRLRLPHPPNRRRRLIRTYCLTCHNETLKTADLVLDTLDSAGLPTDPAIGEKVLKKLRTDAMPPAGRRRPDPLTRICARVAVGEGARPRSGTGAESGPSGRRASAEPRRICQRGSRRALVRDRRTSLLLVDDIGYGFDNIADVLSLSPSPDGVVSWPRPGRSSRGRGGEHGRRSVERRDRTGSRRPSVRIDTRVRDDLPFGTRGGPLATCIPLRRGLCRSVYSCTDRRSGGRGQWSVSWVDHRPSLK